MDTQFSKQPVGKKCLDSLKIFPDSSYYIRVTSGRWVLLYHGPPIPLHGSKGYFPRGLCFTKMYGNFSQVIPELQDKVFQDFCLPTFPVLAS